MNRRHFTFGGLALVLAGPAWASGPTPLAESLEPILTATRQGDELHVEVSVRNRGAEAVELMVARGKRSGASLVALLRIDDQEVQLSEVLSEAQERERRTRRGPERVYAPMPAGAVVSLGRARFVLPPGTTATEGVVRCTVVVDGQSTPLAEQRVSWTGGADQS